MKEKGLQKLGGRGKGLQGPRDRKQSMGCLRYGGDLEQEELGLSSK